MPSSSRRSKANSRSQNLQKIACIVYNRGRAETIPNQKYIAQGGLCFAPAKADRSGICRGLKVWPALFTAHYHCRFPLPMLGLMWAKQHTRQVRVKDNRSVCRRDKGRQSG